MLSKIKTLICESIEEDDVQSDELDDSVMLGNDEENNAIMDGQLKSDDEYVPIFCISVAYNRDADTTDENQVGYINHSKAIGKVTLGENYTHVIISFDTGLEHMWHFDEHGFSQESIMKNNAFEIASSIYVNATFVTKDEAKIIFDEIKRYRSLSGKEKYAISQLVNQLMGKQGHQDLRMMCSTFVGYLLSLGNTKNINRDYSSLRPEDITILPRAFYVISFKDRNDFIARKSEFDERVKKIYDENIDEIRDYNNALPKVMINSKLKEVGTVEKFFDWLAVKLHVV